MSIRRVVNVVALGLLSVAVAQLSAVELIPTEPGTEQPDRVIPRPPPPAPDNALVRAIRTVDVAEPIWYRGLGIFPLVQRRVADDRSYLTLDEALKRGDLVVKELDSAAVAKAVVRNTGKHHVFLLGNEVLVGGMQNRMLREDLLLRPNSGEVVVEVFCIEKGRWSNPESRFRESRRMAQQELRQRAAEGADQSGVWEEVDRFARSYDVESLTGDLDALQADRKVAAELAEYERAILPKLPPETVGLVAVRGPVILGADIFCNGELFEKLRRKIIHSYALTRTPGRPHVQMVIDRRQVEEFLRRCYRAHYSERPAPDVGQRIRLRGGGLTGMGLTFQGTLMHAALFPRPQVRPLPEPLPIPRPLPPRRPLEEME